MKVSQRDQDQKIFHREFDDYQYHTILISIDTNGLEDTNREIFISNMSQEIQDNYDFS